MQGAYLDDFPELPLSERENIQLQDIDALSREREAIVSDALSLMVEIYPFLPRSVLRDLLESVDGELQQAVDLLQPIEPDDNGLYDMDVDDWNDTVTKLQQNDEQLVRQLLTSHESRKMIDLSHANAWLRRCESIRMPFGNPSSPPILGPGPDSNGSPMERSQNQPASPPWDYEESSQLSQCVMDLERGQKNDYITLARAEHPGALRTSALSLNSLRSHCFRAATDAFRKQNWSDASNSMHGALTYSQQASSLTMTAGLSAFLTYNPSILGSQNRSRPIDSVDLHGQTTEQAREWLDLLMDTHAYRQRCTGTLRVVVGVGKHSRGGRPRLVTVVKDWCKERGFSFAGDGEGALKVYLLG